MTRRSRHATNPMTRAYHRIETVTSALHASMPIRPPPHPVRATREIWRWRDSPAGVVVASARLVPQRTAVIDDERHVSFRELDERTNAIAAVWRERGMTPDETVGLLVTNRIAFLEAMFAAQKLGASIVYLNTAFAMPQIEDVVATHAIDVLVHDRVTAEAVGSIAAVRMVDEADLQEAASTGDTQPGSPPARPSRVVVLTSGTTGRPKGAERTEGRALDAAGVLACLPIASGDTALVATPLFHSLGLFTASLTLALRSTVVLAPQFDAERTLELVARHRVATLVVVPVMLQRMLELPDRRLDRYDTTSLRVLLSGGAQLPGELATRAMNRFGEVVHNVYGSSEVGLATVAGPRDLRAAPGTAGRAVPGVSVAVLDDEGRLVPSGVTGRIFVGSSLQMDRYVGGGGKEQVRGLSSTGDVGHLDGSGRLHIEGRDDEMVVSGAENVYPAEVEGVLVRHPNVVEAAVIGVPDVEFGQRLQAFVVLRDRASTTAEELRGHVRAHLARYKVPRDVVFLDALPRGATGKVLVRELAHVDEEVQA